MKIYILIFLMLLPVVSAGICPANQKIEIDFSNASRFDVVYETGRKTIDCPNMNQSNYNDFDTWLNYTIYRDYEDVKIAELNNLTYSINTMSSVCNDYLHVVNVTPSCLQEVADKNAAWGRVTANYDNLKNQTKDCPAIKKQNDDCKVDKQNCYDDKAELDKEIKEIEKKGNSTMFLTFLITVAVTYFFVRERKPKVPDEMEGMEFER